MEINDELKEKLKPHGGTTINISPESFESFAAKLSDAVLKYLLGKHRENRNFYKKILAEEYRAKHPNVSRYADAEKKLKIYNYQGKIISKLIN